MSGETSRLRLKSRRVLPSLPVEAQIKHAVTFNSNTVETSIGGTQTPGKIKPDQLSPVNKLSNESSLRSEDLEYETRDVMDKSNTDASLTDVGHTDSYHHKTSESNGRLNAPINTDGNFSTPVKCNLNSVGNSEKGAINRNLETLHIYEPGGSLHGRSVCTPPVRRHTLDEKLLSTPECYSVVQLDNTRYEYGYGHDIHANTGEEGCSVTVAVRVRPFSQRELADANVRRVVSMSNNETTVTSDNDTVHRFAYDYSFFSFDERHAEFADQEYVYSALAKPLLAKAYEGYNTCLFAYGQTGSGKSYCIMGHGNEVGIIPRFCEELFVIADLTRQNNKVKLVAEISFFEIYNEKIHDLLASINKEKGSKKNTLKVREHPVLGPYVEGLSTFVVNSFDDMNGWITLGNKNRATAATGMNDKSSRSHSVFTIVLTQTKTEELEGQAHDHSITSKINLVDLAGSERQSQAQTSGQRLREGANINKSLLTLGKVISQLAEQSSQTSRRRKVFIPYRDSVLTWLLKESLGGNSKTAMIATISPANHHTDETLSTLRYAKTARSIVNLARVNEDPKGKLIRELRTEIEHLRRSGAVGGDPAYSAGLAEISSLRDKLAQKEREMEEVQRSWQERLQRAEDSKAEEVRQLERAGVTLKVDNRLPNLVNLNEDPQLSEMLLYNIKEGMTHVGRMAPNSRHDIQLNGVLIAENHCVINNEENTINITAIGDAQTYVNGDLITESTTLHHGDRVILGGDHYFRFNHPMEVQNKRRDRPVPGQHDIKDFEFAKSELMRVQEARLTEELETARREAQAEMEAEVERARHDAEAQLDQHRSDYNKRLADLEHVSAEQAREAEDAIHKLKRQKMMLEQEVIASRKRQELETEAAMKASTQQVGERSRLLELLKAEKQNAIRKLEELRQRQRRTEATGPPPTPGPRPTPTVGNMDLYKVALQIREANKICQYLKKPTVFSREDYLQGGELATTIKVTNTRLNVATHWSLAKFDNKLVQMRDFYQCTQNDTDSSADDDDVFNDPDDSWGHDDSTVSPLVLKNGVRHSLTSPGLRHSLLSSTSSVNSPLLRPDQPGGKGTNCQCSRPGVAALCKDVINSVLDQFHASSTEESLADKVLHSCHLLQTSVANISGLDVAMDTDNRVAAPGVVHDNCIQATTAYQGLLGHCCTWTALYQALPSALIHDLLSKMADQVKVIGGQILRFFQGCEGEMGAMLQQASGRIHDGIHAVCRLAGELALATDTHMVHFEDRQHGYSPAVSADVCRSFFSGCEQFIDKTLQGALRTVDDYETKAQTMTDAATHTVQLGEVPQNVEIVVSTCKVLLHKCQEIQVEADQSVMEPHPEPQASCGTTYGRTQAIISHISGLVDSIAVLVQQEEAAVTGEAVDMSKMSLCANHIKDFTEKLTLTCGHQLTSPTRDSQDSQMEQLEFTSHDIQLSIDSLVESVQKVTQLETVTCGKSDNFSSPESPSVL